MLAAYHATTRVLALAALALACGGTDRSQDVRSEIPSYGVPPGFETTLLPDLLARAEQAIAAQKPQEAVDLLVVAASQPSVDPRVRFLYGKALLQTGRASLAIWPLERAAAGSPATAEETLLHAQALLAGGDPLTARRLLGDLLEEAPGNEALLRLRARANRAALDLEGAIRDLEAVVALAPDDLSSREGLISLLLEAKRVDEARAAVGAFNAQVATLDLPEADRARYCVSEALFELQNERIDRSRTLFERCLEAHPDQPNVILPWCHFLEQTGERDRAIDVLREQFEAHGRRRRGWLPPLVGRLVAAGRRAEAEALLREVAEETSDPALFFQLADHRIEWGDLDGARDAAFRAIALQSGRDPRAPDFDWAALPMEGRFALGDLLIRIGDEATVEPLIESLAARSDADEGEVVYPMLLKGRLALERGASADALALFEESFRYWPSNAAARHLAGRAAMELGDFDRGLSLFRDAFRADPAGSDAGLVLARLQQAEGYLLSAADIVSTRLGEASDDPESLLLFAQLASTLSAWESAAKARGDLAKIPAWTGVAHRETALEVARRSGVDAALAALESQADLEDPLQYEALSQWVTFQLDAGHSEAALSRLDRLLRRRPDAAPFRLVRARAHRRLGDLARAREEAEGAVSQDPSLVEGWLELAAIALDLGDRARARAAYAEAHAIDPANERATIGLADVALASGEQEEAKRLYRRTLAVQPWQARAALALARMDFDAGSTSDQTLVWARWAARFGGGLRGEAANLLGRIRLARGESQEAVLAFQVAAKDASSSAGPLLGLARAQLATGDANEALAAVQRAIALGSFASGEEAAEATALLEELQAQ